MVRGHGEMNDSFTTPEFSSRDFQPHGLATITAGSMDLCVGVERGRDSERIPDTNSPVGATSRFDPEAGGHSAKRVSRPDVAVVRSENQNLPGRELLQGRFDFSLRAPESGGNLRRLGYPSGFGSLTEYVQADVLEQ